MQVYVIGRNESGELGLCHTQNISKLTKLEDLKLKDISSVHSAHSFTIYSAGDNTYISG